MGMMRRDGCQLRAGHTLHAHMLQQCPFVLRITRDASRWTGTQLWLFRSLAAASMGDCSLTNSNRQTGLTTSQSVPWHPRPTPQIITTSSGKGAGQIDEGDLAASCTRDEHRKLLKKVLAEGGGPSLPGTRAPNRPRQECNLDSDRTMRAPARLGRDQKLLDLERLSS